MDKNMLCEALYALPSGVVVRRKKSLMPSIGVLIFGLILLSIYFVNLDSMSNNCSSSLVLVAGATLLVAVLMLLTRIFDVDGQPVLAATGKKLRYQECYFPPEKRSEIQRLVDEGALRHLLTMHEGSVSSIGVAVLYSEDKTVAAMQAFEYISFEYRPITGIRIIA